MRITERQLKKIIKEEALKEFSLGSFFGGGDKKKEEAPLKTDFDDTISMTGNGHIIDNIVVDFLKKNNVPEEGIKKFLDGALKELKSDFENHAKHLRGFASGGEHGDPAEIKHAIEIITPKEESVGCYVYSACIARLIVSFEYERKGESTFPKGTTGKTIRSGACISLGNHLGKVEGLKEKINDHFRKVGFEGIKSFIVSGVKMKSLASLTGEGRDSSGDILVERWQRLAGIIKG